MPIWAWIVIAVAVILIAAGAWYAWRLQQRRKLRGTFGPEYERTVDKADSRREAEGELKEREQRRRELDIRPLSPAAWDRLSGEWRRIQEHFVDAPAEAVREADQLVSEVMDARRYPPGDVEQRASDLSVDYPALVEDYRRSHDLAERSARGQAQTEALRRAMLHYRTLFDQLLGTPEERREPDSAR